jgi:hypothetical protein
VHACKVTISNYFSRVSSSLLTPSPIHRDRGRLIGRDPRRLGAADYLAAGLAPKPPMKAIRAYCLDCAGRPAEVRKCVAVQCPLWPLRMGRWVGRLSVWTEPPAPPG